MFPLFLFFVWLFASLLPVLEKKAKRESGGVSVVPIVPLFPLAAWGLAAILDLIHDRLGYYIVGGLHVILLACATGLRVKYAYAIRRNTRRDRESQNHQENEPPANPKGIP